MKEECDGKCSTKNECEGEIVPVVVLQGGFEFHFDYCQEAIRLDRENNFTVKQLLQR